MYLHRGYTCFTKSYNHLFSFCHIPCSFDSHVTLGKQLTNNIELLCRILFPFPFLCLVLFLAARGDAKK